MPVQESFVTQLYLKSPIQGEQKFALPNCFSTMRLTCDVDITNRLLPAFNMKSKGRSQRAHLSVGCKPGDNSKDGDVYLMMCTKNDRNGAKYKLRGNIQQVFSKFIQDGKATIRFQEPPHDLCMSKADPLQLKSFMSVVRLGYQGAGLDKVKLSSLAPASAKQVEKLKTKLSIKNRRDYPLTTGFPSSIEALQVHECNLKRVDSRMLLLRRLRVLDLSSNRIQTLPEDLGNLTCLSELKLSDNQVSALPQGMCTGNLANTLTLLDLSKNKLRLLRPFFCQLKALVTLNLDANELVCLPMMVGRMPSLRYLTAAQNQLKTLPATFSQVRLDSLDLFGNPFLQDGPSTAINKLHFPSLVEIAARAVKQHRLSYTEEDVPGFLLEYLNNAKWCVCDKACFQCHVHYLARLDLHRVAASLTAVDSSGRTTAPAEAFLCSQTCLSKYQKNPYATIWR